MTKGRALEPTNTRRLLADRGGGGGGQGLVDRLFHIVDRDEPGEDAGDDAVAVDEVARGHAQSAVLAEERVVRVHPVDGEGHAGASVGSRQRTQEIACSVKRFAAVYRDHGYFVTAGLLDVVDVGHLGLAWRTPGGPEVDEDHLATEVAQAVPDAVEVVDFEIRGKLADLGAGFEFIAAFRFRGVDHFDVVDSFASALAADQSGHCQHRHNGADDGYQSGQGDQALLQGHWSGVGDVGQEAEVEELVHVDEAVGEDQNADDDEQGAAHVIDDAHVTLDAVVDRLHAVVGQPHG